MNELKPCPFCGSKDIHIGEEFWPHYVYCSGCGTQTRSLKYAQEGIDQAIERWNRRAYEQTEA